ncbi:Endogenous Retrovirus Group Fc1 Member 1 Env Polyprotein [Manis pentadactyla]|nr:Endogenous Retrovirus Group Fc1 Member 1 Env Polyprotein [Manis pentadactyla]
MSTGLTDGKRHRSDELRRLRDVGRRMERAAGLHFSALGSEGPGRKEHAHCFVYDVIVILLPLDTESCSCYSRYSWKRLIPISKEVFIPARSQVLRGEGKEERR